MEQISSVLFSFKAAHHVIPAVVITPFDVSLEY